MLISKIHPITITRTKDASSAVRLTKPQLKEVFKQFDSNGDSQLSKEEVEKAFNYLGSRWPWYRAYNAGRQADANGDGVIDCSNNELDALVNYAFKIQYTVPSQ